MSFIVTIRGHLLVIVFNLILLVLIVALLPLIHFSHDALDGLKDISLNLMRLRLYFKDLLEAEYNEL
jgi:hypothetical protein